MLRKNESSRYAAFIDGALSKEYLPDDFWRLENNFFGTKFVPEVPEGTALFVGARSGLEIIRLLESHPRCKIYVVEANDLLCQEIISSLKRVRGGKWLSRVFLFDSIDKTLAALGKKMISFVRIDERDFSLEDTTRLITKYRISHICGEFDLLHGDPLKLYGDPLKLYRICKARVGSFHWQIRGEAGPITGPISGSGSNFKFEISVVVPCYNVLPWVDRCLDTLVHQTLESVEIIAVNDGSTDHTGQRLDEWASKYPGRVKVIHQSNGGCASARNMGLKAARGEFVAFVDADDWVDVRMFEELYRAAVLNSVDVSQCGYAEVFEESERIEIYSTDRGGSADDGLTGIVRDLNPYLIVKPTIWRRIYRKSLLDAYEIRFAEHLRRFDDLPFQFEVFSRINSMAIIPESYYFYRQEREGQDIAVRDHRLFVHFPIFKVLFQRVAAWADADVERYLLQCKLNTHLWALGRIERKFFITYLKQASLDLSRNNFHHSDWDLLKSAKNWGIGAFTLALASTIVSKFVKEVDVPCD